MNNMNKWCLKSALILLLIVVDSVILISLQRVLFGFVYKWFSFIYVAGIAVFGGGNIYVSNRVRLGEYISIVFTVLIWVFVLMVAGLEKVSRLERLNKVVLYEKK